MSRLADDELDAGERVEVERHVDGCVRCADELRGIVALRTRMRSESLRHPLPAGLAARIAERIEASRPTARASANRWWWLGSGALGGAVAAASAFVLFVAIETGRTSDALVDEVVAVHGRAATTGHLIDVASSDRHLVRPWLSARLDYSPPVPDLAADGFELVGGRLDRLERSAVATLVYRYGHHTIDVFVRPATGRVIGSDPAAIRGFHVLRSRGTGMDWIGISDVDPTVLATLMRRLADVGTPTGPEPTAVR